MISQAAFRDAMARLAAAVHVVTTDGEAGRAGFTASAVSSVTDDPPTLLVCMHRGSRYNDVFKINGVLCVTALGPEHTELSASRAMRRCSFTKRIRDLGIRLRLIGLGVFQDHQRRRPVVPEHAIRPRECDRHG